MIEAVLMDAYHALLSDRHLSLDEALDRMMSVQGSVCTKMAFVTDLGNKDNASGKFLIGYGWGI